MYALLRAIAGVALRWYYRDIQVEGIERIPRHRPVLLAVNHPNALVDALLVGWVVPRRVRITAKATLFQNHLADALLRWLGVLPLRRASDEATTGRGDRSNPARNRGTFRAVHDALRRGETVLVFPEGRTHDEPTLTPLKTGAARMALHARDAGDVHGLAIVPIGLIFERKEAPRTRVLVRVGEPVLVDEWRPPAGERAADALTGEIERRLRAVTLNYPSSDDATRAIRLASLIAALFDDAPPIGVVDRGLGVEVAIARRIDLLEARVSPADTELRSRADHLLRRLDAVQRGAAKHGILLEDVGISLRRRAAARFIVREGWLLVVGGPVALWGRLNHWLPFGAARMIAARSVESAADPAMRTLVAGTAFVALTYVAQTALVGVALGLIPAAVYLVSLPLAAEVNFYLSGRLGRAARRARTFLRFRRDPELQTRLEAELSTLRAEVLAFDRMLTGEESPDAASA